jgi:hypothetical protein
MGTHEASAKPISNKGVKIFMTGNLNPIGQACNAGGGHF